MMTITARSLGRPLGQLLGMDRWVRAGAMAVYLAVGLVVVAGCATTNPELRHRGHTSYLAGEYERSRDFYAQAVRQRPTDIEAQYGLGRAYLGLAQYRDALAAFEHALSMAGGDRHRHLMPDILDGHAEALYRLDRREQLHDFLQSSVERYGTTRDRMRQGKYLAQIGDMDGAETAYRRAARLASDDDLDPWIALVDFYRDINDVPRAVQFLRYAASVSLDDRRVRERASDLEVVLGPAFAEDPPRALVR